MTKEERAFNYASTRKATKFQVGEIAKFYNDGYEQAEKDLALTSDDIRIITKILEEVTDEDILVEFYNGDAISCYKEVLRRFKEAKNGQD